MEQAIHNIIFCPITKMIMYEPVLVESGQIFEEEAIMSWFITSDKCPVTAKIISHKIIFPVVSIKNLINDYLSAHPKYKVDQFVPSNNHSNNLEIVNRIFSMMNFDGLLNYKMFKAELFLKYDNNIFRTIFSNCRYDVIKHVIDDLEINAEDYWKVMHPAFRYGTIGIIKYMIDKGVPLECKNLLGETLIHSLFSNTNIKLGIVKYIVEKGADLKCKTFKNKRPIHYLADNYYADLEIFEYISTVGVDFNTATDDGIIALHYAAMSAKNNVVEFIADRTIDFDSRTIKGVRPIHIIYKYTPSITFYESIRSRCKIIDEIPKVVEDEFKDDSGNDDYDSD